MALLEIRTNNKLKRLEMLQGGFEGLLRILSVAFILSKCLHIASQTLTFALKIERKVVYHHSYDLGACESVLEHAQCPCLKVNLFLRCI